MRRKIQTKNITIASGTTANTQRSFDVTFDSQFKDCKGIGVAVSDNGGDADFLIGFVSPSFRFDQATNKLYTIDSNVRPKDRLYPTDVEANGERCQITIELKNDLVRDLDVSVVFELENSGETC